MAMSALMASGDCYVTLELPTGEVFTGKAMVAEVMVDQPVYRFGDDAPSFMAGQSRWDMTLTGLGELPWRGRKEHGKQVETYRKEPEWRCPYCGAINLRDTRHCDGCNAWRPWALGGE